MPLNPKLKAIIDADTTMTPEYKVELSKVMGEASAEFQNNWMANQDYQRRSNTLTEREKKWLDWEKVANDTVAAKELELSQAQEKVRDLEAQLTTAAATGTPAEVTKLIADLKGAVTGLQEKISKTAYVTPEDLDKKISEATKHAVGFMGDHVGTRDRIQHQHFATFGKHLTPTELDDVITFTNEQSKTLGRQLGFEEGYQLKHKEEIKKAETEKLHAEWEKDYATRNGTPTSAGGTPEKGPLQIRMEQTQGKELAPGNDNIMEAKAKAAAALRISSGM